ncbi:MAG: alpha-galactosidase [Sphingomonadales bacterium]|jgi:alpha-galactosidase|nr:alpha-galactosidase [Sphingomonadales bacterium]
MAIEFEPDGVLVWRGIRLSGIEPLVDGRPASSLGLAAALDIQEDGDALRLSLRMADVEAPQSLGLRFGRVEGVRLYLRNGYQSWDGSFFVEPGTPPGDGPPAKSPALGFAMTALLPQDGEGALVVGFTRHDRFQNRFRFGGEADAFTFDMETLFDGAAEPGAVEAEPIVLLVAEDVEEALRSWSRLVAAESPLPPRLPERRITGWCSWYSLYAAIDEATILDHLGAATAFRDRHRVPLDVFQIDDGFTPEMGDWLDVKPQFPRGMKPVLAEVEAAGFVPGLWIAPFMVGNRSRLYAEHPDWVVKRRDDGAPLAHMKFYGEFRWHKRSEEYYILDVTHPEAEAHIRRVFRIWRRDWGARYFKTDFMLFGGEYGPDVARWHRDGLSRIRIWRLMAALIREEIGEDSLWLGCGCPLWASVGYVDAVRIGRDIGVTWNGDYSAESLLRDQLTRNHGSGILWQADPDCILLRDRFHDLTGDQIRSLALFAGLAGGVLMTSDKLDELSDERAQLFAALLRERRLSCSFPGLGRDEPLIVQWSRRPDGSEIVNLFNPADAAIAAAPGLVLPPHASALTLPRPDDPLAGLASVTPD